MICLLLAGAVPAGAAKPTRVQIGFVSTQTVVNGSPVIPSFQNVLLNVVSVRINKNAAAAPNAGGWQKIPAPPGIGGNGTNAELQIDLNTSQNIPELFNTSNVRPETYKIVQLVLDPTNPGTLIPICPASPPADGCINYPLQINNPNGITVSAKDLFPTSTGNLASLILQVTLTITKVPSGPGGSYTGTVTVAPVSGVVTGNITGQVTVSGTAPTSKIRKLTVSAETIGTNTVIATAPIKPGNTSNCTATSPGGCFTLTLPAAGGPSATMQFGTLYDLAISGGGATYAAERLQPLFPGGAIAVDPKAFNNLMGNQTLGSITGTVTDGCVASKTIAGATLQLLIPPAHLTNMTTPPPANFCIVSPEQCISVATANTDNTGTFPLPGAITTPAAFDSVPILGKNANPYVMEVTAPGYNPLFVLAKPGNGTGKTGIGTCSIDGGNTFNKCDLLMMTGYIAGAFPILPPNPGQTVLVQVMAEDHGTNNIQSALPMPITVNSNKNVTNCVPAPPNGTVCANFKLNVPATTPAAPVGPFDLFASTIDLYQGVVDPYQGHSIAVVSDVAAPTACQTVAIPTPMDPSQVITCVGHGSITGTVATPNLGESVVLEKLDAAPPPGDDNPEVQITNSIVENQPPNSGSTSNFSFCAPADTYELQKAELVPAPVSSVVPSAAPTATPVDASVSVTIPLPPNAGGPSPTPTPALKCPTNCSHPDGTCPGICSNAFVSAPL